MSDFYCYYDLSDDPECVEQCGRCHRIESVSSDNERLIAEHEAIDLKKAIELLAAVSNSLTLREIVETSDFPAAIKRIERLSSESGLRLDLLKDIRADLEARADKKLATRVDLGDDLYALLRNVTASEELEHG